MYQKHYSESLESLLSNIDKSDIVEQLAVLLNSASHYADKNYSAHQWMKDITLENDPFIPTDVTWPEAIHASIIYTFINDIRRN